MSVAVIAPSSSNSVESSDILCRLSGRATDGPAVLSVSASSDDLLFFDGIFSKFSCPSKCAYLTKLESEMQKNQNENVMFSLI